MRLSLVYRSRSPVCPSKSLFRWPTNTEAALTARSASTPDGQTLTSCYSTKRRGRCCACTAGKLELCTPGSIVFGVASQSSFPALPPSAALRAVYYMQMHRFTADKDVNASANIMQAKDSHVEGKPRPAHLDAPFAWKESKAYDVVGWTSSSPHTDPDFLAALQRRKDEGTAPVLSTRFKWPTAATAPSASRPSRRRAGVPPAGKCAHHHHVVPHVRN